MNTFYLETTQYDYDLPVATSIYKKGAYIYTPDEAALNVHIIIKGGVKIENFHKNGKQFIKSILSTGDFLGEMALFGETLRRDFACAIDEVIVQNFPIAEMQHLLLTNLKLQGQLMDKLAFKIKNLEERLTSIVFDNSKSRVIGFLVYLAQQQGKRIGYETLVSQFYTQQEIANYTATSRQTVNAVLNDLQANNLLTYNRNRLLIRDLTALKQELRSTR